VRYGKEMPLDRSVLGRSQLPFRPLRSSLPTDRLELNADSNLADAVIV
jgi:hypothetical protein